MTTIADALASTRKLPDAADNSRLDGERLLAHVLGVSRSALYAHPERPIGDREISEFRRLLKRRGKGEPIAYLLGNAGFMHFQLAVDPCVLIPRPETELLVELALESAPEGNTGPLQIADLGTGSGAIAIALARRKPDWRIHAVDISPQALALARRNARELGARNISFREASWCEGLADSALDMIVANPPYVAVGDPALHPDCAFEPDMALFAGADGLSAIREIINQARRCLKAGGLLLLEHGHDQREPVAGLLSAAGYRDIRHYRDHAGHDRLIHAREGRRPPAKSPGRFCDYASLRAE